MSVDIIIPAYNPGKDLVDAVKSCFNQSFKDFNIIIVDDNSDVNIKRLVWDFPDITLLKTPKNIGPAGARNFGIKNSKSEVISFLDSDDIMHKDKLKLSLPFLSDSSEYGMVCGNYRVIVNRKTLKPPFYKRSFKIDHRMLLRQNFVASGSVSLKRSVIEDVGLFDESLWIAEDYDLWLRVSERYRIKYLHDVLYFYSVIPGGTSLTQRDDIQKDHNQNILKIRERSAERMKRSKRGAHD